jgi:NAD(P)-dependent dehydrogenase (short-subunit alcohol dehydrogenase family)
MTDAETGAADAPEWMNEAVAVVTGAGSGIGRALAHRFAGAGMRVMLADIDGAAVEGVAAELTESGAEVAARRVDVAEAEQVEALAEATLKRFGQVNVICNNAGISSGGLCWEIPLEDWRWTIDVNLYGVIHGIRSFVPRIIESGGGHVVNTASMAGLVAAPGMSPYNATKHAVVGISETLFYELEGSAPGVGVSVLCPGWVNTNILDAGRNRQERYGPVAELPEEAAGMRSLVAELIRAGLDPAEVAELVFRSIGERRFWVFTHEDWLGAAKARFDRAFGGENPALVFPGT